MFSTLKLTRTETSFLYSQTLREDGKCFLDKEETYHMINPSPRTTGLAHLARFATKLPQTNRERLIDYSALYYSFVTYVNLKLHSLNIGFVN